MKFIYGVTEEVYVLGDTTRIAYGIAAYAGSETDQTFTIAASVRDISPDKCSHGPRRRNGPSAHPGFFPCPAVPD